MATCAKPKTDYALEVANASVTRALTGKAGRPVVECFFDEPTFTASYVVHDPATKKAAIIDSVLDYDAASGRTSFDGANQIVDYVREHDLHVEWLLETHAHADHLSAAPHLKSWLGGAVAIGREITQVQSVFGEIFNAGEGFAHDGSQFDRLFDDGDSFEIGELEVHVLHVPGHTPADLAYLIGDAAFVGDTLFMPDYGTARADFPGGNAKQLYHSIRRLLALPRKTRIFLCHDYKAEGREEFVWESTVGAQRDENIHVHVGVSETEFSAMRTKRDAALGMPKLMLPSIQVNMRGGAFPEPEDNGVTYLRIPLNEL